MIVIDDSTTAVVYQGSCILLMQLSTSGRSANDSKVFVLEASQ
eukprot:COSAG02_NODE_10364_length_1958_cov_2.222700_1_plen_42_part_10